MAKAVRSAILQIRLTPGDKKLLELEAAKRNRTVAGLAQLIITRTLRKKSVSEIMNTE